MVEWLNALHNSFLKELCHGELTQSKLFSLVREQRKAPLATKKLILLCSPLDMNVPFKIYLAFSKSWMLRDKVCEKHRKRWFNCFSTHSPRNGSNDQMWLKKRRFKMTAQINRKQPEHFYFLDFSLIWL